MDISFFLLNSNDLFLFNVPPEIFLVIRIRIWEMKCGHWRLRIRFECCESQQGTYDWIGLFGMGFGVMNADVEVILFCWNLMLIV